MSHYIEVYFRQKGGDNWETAKGILSYNEFFNPNNLLEDLVIVHPELEFNSLCLWIKNCIFEDIGSYELSDLFKHPKINNKYKFEDRENLGFLPFQGEVFQATQVEYCDDSKEDLPF